MEMCSAKVGLTFIAAIAVMATLGTGTAEAKDQYVGHTYAYAAGKIAAKGGVPVVSSVVGDQLARDECIVTSSRQARYVHDNFDHDKNFLLALNCAAKVAGAGRPGNSLASPQGRAAKTVEVRAEKYNNDPQRCAKNLNSCKKFCNTNVGSCSKEVMSLF